VKPESVVRKAPKGPEGIKDLEETRAVKALRGKKAAPDLREILRG